MSGSPGGHGGSILVTLKGKSFGMGRTLIALLILVAAGPAAGQRLVMERATAAKAADQPAARQALASMAAHHDRADTPGLVATTRRLAADPLLGPAGRDRVLVEAAKHLAAMPDHSEGRRFLEALTDETGTVWVPAEEAAGYVQLPLYDIAAQARFSLRELDVRAAARDLAPRVVRGEPGLAQEAREAAPGSVFREGLARVLGNHRPGGTLADALAAELPADPTLGRLILAARDPADDAALLAVLDYGDAESGLRAVTLTRQRPTAEALRLLRQAARRPDLASSAVLEAGRRLNEDPVAEQWLEDLLGDPVRGASAAAGLARWGDPALIDRLAERIAGEADELTARHLVLVLRLSATAAADRAMAGLRDDPAVSAAIREELR